LSDLFSDWTLCPEKGHKSYVLSKTLNFMENKERPVQSERAFLYTIILKWAEPNNSLVLHHFNESSQFRFHCPAVYYKVKETVF
jgi:hypothetical protein